MDDSPSSILLVRDLSPHLTEQHVHQALAPFNTRIMEIRMISDKRLCFIDYGSVAAAQGVYRAAIQGLWLHDTQVRLTYARPKDVTDAGPAAEGIGSGVPKDVHSAPAAPPHAVQVPDGFVYDENSGWYYSAATNYYFDANSQIYYEPTGAKYYKFDLSAQQYVECEAGAMR